MGNQSSQQPKTTKSVAKKKIESAKNTGVLSLSSHKLTEIPISVFTLSNLKVLDISQNNIKVLPMKIICLVKLKTLQVRDNKLKEFPDIDQLVSLKQLSLDGNGLVRLGALPSGLKTLDVARNGFTEVPSPVMTLQDLESLDVSENPIEALAPQLGQLSSLHSLTADGCRIACVPAALASAPRLKQISLRGNQIRACVAATGEQSIPAVVLSSSCVDVLRLDNNPLRKPELMDMAGVEDFLARRTQLKNKDMHGGIDTEFSVCGLDE